MKRKRVLLVSPAHPANDPRIIYKLAPALAESYEVWCALPGATPSSPDGIRWLRLPRFRSLTLRLLFTHPCLLAYLLWLRPQALHLLMPELLPVGFLARLLGVEVIYEVQENLYQKFPIKRRNNAPLYQSLFRWFDRRARRVFPMIFTEPAYRKEYSQLARPHVIIHNYPDLDRLKGYRKPYMSAATGQPELLYIGLVSLERGLDTIIEAAALLKPRYPTLKIHFFGRRQVDQRRLEALPAYHQVRNNLLFYGQTDQAVALPYAARCLAGLAILHPVGDYPESYPTKLFEYMALGLPVLTSDFPLYKSVVEPHASGYCLQSDDAQALAGQIEHLINHPAEARQLGLNGRRAVEQAYNWTTEKSRLLTFYHKLLH